MFLFHPFHHPVSHVFKHENMFCVNGTFQCYSVFELQYFGKCFSLFFSMVLVCNISYFIFFKVIFNVFLKV